MRVFTDFEELAAEVGKELAVSQWLDIGQSRIDAFAEATGDHQWVHVDPKRSAEGPFGATIAHGFLTLSLIPYLSQSAYRIEGIRMGVNYGLNKVRFTAPVPVGSRLRARFVLKKLEPLPESGVQLTTEVTVERDGSDRPVCVAETVARMYR